MLNNALRSAEMMKILNMIPVFTAHFKGTATFPLFMCSCSSLIVGTKSKNKKFEGNDLVECVFKTMSIF